MNERAGQGSIQERAARIFCVLAVLVCVWAALRLAGRVVGIFFVSWLVSSAIDPLARKSSKLLHMPRKALAVLYLVLLTALAFAAVYFAVSRLCAELDGVLAWLRSNGELASELAESAPERIGEALGISAEAVTSLAERAVSSVGEALAKILGALLRGAPEALITVIATLCASVYMCLDREGIVRAARSVLPRGAGERLGDISRRLSGALKAYARAYAVIFVMTATELFVGLSLMRVRCAFSIACFIAAVDILPVLGAGAVLIPWGVCMLIAGNSAMGLGLLTLYGVMTVVRQLAEPRIVGSRLGVHPLWTLMFTLLAIELLGLVGIIIGPLGANLVWGYFSFKKEK